VSWEDIPVPGRFEERITIPALSRIQRCVDEYPAQEALGEESRIGSFGRLDPSIFRMSSLERQAPALLVVLSARDAEESTSREIPFLHVLCGRPLAISR